VIATGFEMAASRAAGEHWRPRTVCDQCGRTAIRQAAMIAFDADQLPESRFAVKRALPLIICGWGCMDKLRATFPDGRWRTMSFRDVIAALAADILPSTAADPAHEARLRIVLTLGRETGRWLTTKRLHAALPFAVRRSVAFHQALNDLTAEGRIEARQERMNGSRRASTFWRILASADQPDADQTPAHRNGAMGALRSERKELA
jgi:hypothetical protein